MKIRATLHGLFEKSFRRELTGVALPIAVQSFMLALVSVTDAVMLGSIAQDAMSAASYAGQVQFFLSLKHIVLIFSFGELQ